MTNKTKTVFATAVTAVLFGIPCIANAASVAKGELNFTGGQTNKVVYADIRDAKPKNDKVYKVIAKVKVGGNTYNSGWKDDQAYVEHSRHWYTNEHSYYDYYQR